MHLFKKNKVKKTKSANKNILNKQQLEMLLNNKINDEQMKKYTNQILGKLDEKAHGKKYPVYTHVLSDVPNNDIGIEKFKSRYIIRNNSGDLLLNTKDRKEAKDMIYYMLK